MTTRLAHPTHATLRPSREAVAAIRYLLPESHASRCRLYIYLATALYVVAWGLVLIRAWTKHTSIDFAVSDAVGYYAYLPSCIIDGDLRFQNQLQAQFHGKIPPDFGQAPGSDGFAVSADKNRWPIGVAVSLAPAFVVAHALSLPLYALTGSSAFEPTGYSILYFVLCVAMAMAIGTAGMILADRLLIERFGLGGRVTAAAVLTWWLGTNYLWFFVREPLIGHMIGASWIILATYFLHRLDEESANGRLRGWQPAGLAFALSMAVVCRYTNVVFVTLFAYVVVMLARQRLLWRAVRQSPLILLALSPLILQAIVLHRMNMQVAQGGAQSLGYTHRERFYWTQPALVLTLFSSRRGLFFWTPLLLLAAWGLTWRMLRRRGSRDPILICLIVSALALWYINASWYAWWLGNSAGNRGFIELAVLFIIGFGFAYTWLQQLAPAPRRVVLLLVLVGFLVNYAVIGLKLLGHLEGHGPLLKWEARVFTGRWARF